MIEEIKKLTVKIKELRVEIDGLSQLVKELKPIFEKKGAFDAGKYINSKEIEKSYDSLILAKAWLGKILQELGESTPYANDGKRKNVEDIEAAVDISTIKEELTKLVNVNTILTINNFHFREASHIEKVDWLREEIKKAYKNNMNMFPLGTNQKLVMANNYYTHLNEAVFWLGFELGRIKNNK